MPEGLISSRGWRTGVALLALCTLARAGGDEGPGAWIMRMNKALATRNYDGVLVHQVGQHRSVLRIVHRVQDGHMEERVTVESPAGPGPGREFVRNGSEWIEYDPQQRVARVQTRNRSYGFLIALNGLGQQTGRYYAMTDDGNVMLDAWTARRISLEPRDALRYGFRFWLDARTALPLKTQLVSRSGEVIEEITFLSMSLPEHIEDEQLKPQFDTTGFHWVRGEEPMYTPGLKSPPVPRAELLPAGFRVILLGSPEQEAKAPGPRTRFIVSDGIDWVSVYVEKGGPAAARQMPGHAGQAPEAPGLRPDGVVVMGSTAVYVASLDGFNVTVVGEVPPATVKAIAEAVRPE
ncbi:MAG TPA: MucB/RseB C-terminal domain-containing protein [Steroidobacteraceae bacterium]|nr:MucB/RseB C-terminal domain-containing protein [Steroidobacteraceae bacterium]